MFVILTDMEAETAMHYRTFDTHKYIKNLQETGFNEKQAEMLIKSLLESRDFELSTLATREQLTKAELKLQKEIFATRDQVTKVETKLEKQITNVESRLQKEISATREQITKVESKLDSFKWITPLIFTMIAMMVAMLLKLFF